MQGTAVTGALVSAYAAQNEKELVAEVFAATILGVNLSPDVMREYTALGEPLSNDF